MRTTKTYAGLPIGRTARVAYDIDTLRAACSKAASGVLKRDANDEAELEECAQLDDALAAAQRILKASVRNVMLSRLARNSRTR